MLFRLFLLFSVIPLIELAILIEIGRNIGALYTILIVVLTGALGAFLARQQGFATASRIKESLNKGKIPADDMIGGLLILAGGLMLLTPGILTDLAGFTMIIPATRNFYIRFIRKSFSGYVSGRVVKGPFSFSSEEEDGVYDGSATDISGDEEK